MNGCQVMVILLKFIVIVTNGGDLVWQCLYTDKHGFRKYPEGTVGKNDKITHWRQNQLPSEVQNETQ